MLVWGVMENFKIIEEYLTLLSIHDSTKGTDIFREFHAILREAHLDPSKMFAVATYGFPFLLGANQRLIDKLPEGDHLPLVTRHHFTSHHENLVAKFLSVANVTEM